MAGEQAPTSTTLTVAKDYAVSITNSVADMASAAKTRSIEAAKVGSDKGLQIARDPKVQVTVASAAGGAAVVGVGGAGAGLLAGGAMGAAVGVLPAFFTFGLSIPVGAAIGGGCGSVIGGVTGASTGFVGGATVGYGSYTKRAEIGTLVNAVKTSVSNISKRTRTNVVQGCTKVKQHVLKRSKAIREKTGALLQQTSAKTKAVVSATATRTSQLAGDKLVQTSAMSSFAGAAVVGTGGATTGLLAGGALGAAVGVVPAIFTFGLSIPVCAALGGGFGLVTGATVGGATGGIMGGASGYVGYTRRDTIRGGLDKMKDSAVDSADKVRAMLIGTTGGTA